MENCDIINSLLIDNNHIIKYDNIDYIESKYGINLILHNIKRINLKVYRAYINNCNEASKNIIIGSDIYKRFFHFVKNDRNFYIIKQNGKYYVELSKFIYAISYGFIWINTDEGHEYWQELEFILADALRKSIKSK